MSYNVYCSADLGAGNTGKTVYGKLLDAAGAQVGSTITVGIVESSAFPGKYAYTATVPDGHAGEFVLYDSANISLRRSFPIAPRETENADVRTSSLFSSFIDISDAIASLNNLSEAQAQTAAAAAITAAGLPNAAALVAAIMAEIVTGALTVEDVLRNLWSVTVGDSEADDPDDPTTIAYKDADGNIDVTHTLTDTTRAQA